jgi:hypothetical protein
MKVLLIALIGVLALSAQQAQAQDLSTSVEYINSKLDYLSHPFDYKYSGQVQSDNCSFIYTAKYFGYSDRNYSDSKYSFRFEDLDASTITLEAAKRTDSWTKEGSFYKLEIQTIGNYKKVKELNDNRSSDYISFFSDDKETLERLKKAFISAINHCKDADPFK